MQANKDAFNAWRRGSKMNTGAFIHDLLDWIDNNLDSRLDIENRLQASRLFEMASPADLQRTYRLPSRRIYSRAKLQKSVERLAQSDEPILNVAIALGFDSQQSFNRSFKRQYGQAPGHGDAVSAAVDPDR